jgi:hypothetical protein
MKSGVSTEANRKWWTSVAVAFGLLRHSTFG